jgi:hypothetical protein
MEVEAPGFNEERISDPARMGRWMIERSREGPVGAARLRAVGLRAIGRACIEQEERRHVFRVGCTPQKRACESEVRGRAGIVFSATWLLRRRIIAHLW